MILCLPGCKLQPLQAKSSSFLSRSLEYPAWILFRQVVLFDAAREAIEIPHGLHRIRSIGSHVIGWWFVLVSTWSLQKRRMRIDVSPKRRERKICTASQHALAHSTRDDCSESANHTRRTFRARLARFRWGWRGKVSVVKVGEGRKYQSHMYCS